MQTVEIVSKEINPELLNEQLSQLPFMEPQPDVVGNMQAGFAVIPMPDGKTLINVSSDSADMEAVRKVYEDHNPEALSEEQQQAVASATNQAHLVAKLGETLSSFGHLAGQVDSGELFKSLESGDRLVLSQLLRSHVALIRVALSDFTSAE